MHPLLDLWVPAVLILVMFVVGSELAFEDFRRLNDRWVILGAATAAQILLLPAMASLLVFLFDPVASTAVGLLLLSVCPGGAISNFYAHLVKADVALSVVLTAITSVACIVTTPLGAAVVCSLVLSQETRVDMLAGRIMMQLALFVLLPISLGMWWRSRQPERTRRWRPALDRISILGLIGLLIAILVDQRSAFGVHTGELIGLAIAFTLAGFGLGTALGWILHARQGEISSLALEFSVRNLAVMALIAVSILDRLEYLLFGAVIFIVQMPTALIAVGVLKRLGTRPASIPPA